MNSFSSKIKKELSEINNLNNKDQVQAELYGYLLTTSSNKFITENQYNINRFSKLLNNCGENKYKIEMIGKNFCIILAKKNLEVLMQKLQKFECDSNDQEDNFQNNIQSNELNKAIVRGAFMSSGSVSNPKNIYHLEIIFDKKENAEKIKKILDDGIVETKILKRAKTYILYIKDGENISRFLAFIGANKSVLDFEDERVLKDMRNNVNRIVNCETSNLSKTISTSIRQIEDIKFIKAKKKFDKLTLKEQELANLRLQNPEASLVELGKLLDKPISKSGVNHRLNAISKLAEELRTNNKE